MPSTLQAMFEYKFITLLPNNLAISALKTDSYLFKSVFTLLQSISLICYSVSSFPKYCFELPDKAHATREIVKCGFWRKLPLLPLLWHANTVDEN